MNVSGKVAIVTGAAQGLGKAFSEILLKNGAKVTLTDVNNDLLTKTASELGKKYGPNKVLSVKCDVTSSTETKEMFLTVIKQWGTVDIVVNNAGVGFEMEELWEKTVDINVKGTLRVTMLAIEHMRQDRGGSGGVIVNIASMAGINPNPCGPVYGATKSAIVMFSRAWAKNPELLANGVRINVLAPAFVETEMMATLADKSRIHVPALAEQIIRQVGVMRPETVAEALLELITDQNKNGAVLKLAQASGKEYLVVV